MKRLLMLTLVLALLCGVARAEIPAELKDSVYAQYGVFSAYGSDYSDDPDDAVPCVGSVQAVDPDLNLVRIAMENRLSRFSPGILSQAEWDLDGDGEEEWIVLRQTPEVEEDEHGVFLELYGRQGDALVLLASEKMNYMWGCNLQMNFYLYQLDGEPCLFAYDVDDVNGAAVCCRIFSLSKSGFASVATLRTGADGSNDDFAIYANGVEEVNYTYDWVDIDNPYTSERSAASEAFCERYGLQISSADPDDAPYPDGQDISLLILESNDYGHGAYLVRPMDIFQTLLECYHPWKDESPLSDAAAILVLPLRGQFLVTTGAANLRGAPSLDGEKAGSIPEGTWLRFLHRVQTDDRGVDWYEVEHKGSTLWISSKFARLQ